MPSVGPALRAVAVWSAIALLVARGDAAPAVSSEIRETADFRDVAGSVEQQIDQFGARNVLLVLDIDNTLLAMNQPLGSDQWFEWQKHMLENDSTSKYLVAADFAGLLEAQGLLYNLARMSPPQRNQPWLLQRLQRRGIRTLVLTSRGPEFRVATERELGRAGYDFAATALPVRGLPRGEYLPYNRDELADAGLTPQEASAFRLDEPRPVSYSGGIFLTAGQPKGAMLLTILHHATVDVRCIVYGDDNLRHVAYVFAAAISRGNDITAFHYTHEEEKVQRFRYGDKEKVHRRWRKLTRTLDEVLE